MTTAALFDDPAAEVVAKVAVDVPLAHLDRPFDYAIPERLASRVRPGVRVKVRFAGQDVDGWVSALGPRETTSQLSSLRAVVSDEQILTPELEGLIRAVADHYAGTWWDVARLAIPARHATVEQELPGPWPEPDTPPEPTVLPGFPGGAELLATLRSGGSPRGFWQVPPVSAPAGDLWAGVIEASAATLAGGRSVIVLVPTHRQLLVGAERMRAAFGAGCVAELAAELGRAERYRNYLAIHRGQARLVIGTRSAAFAPVADPGLIVVVDDGHDGHVEERSPRHHARTVAMLRTVRDGCALLLASHARSTEVQGLLELGWLHAVELSPRETRSLSPAVRAVAPGHRLPPEAFAVLRAGLASGPVLVGVARAGHSTGLRCTRCRRPARCTRCHGPLVRPTRDRLECVLCGATPVRWECEHCHGTRLSAPGAGSERTAEELGRAFPGVSVMNSSAERIRNHVPEGSAIVVATPGGEPRAPHGYAAALILDADLTLARSDLRAGEEALRRWLTISSLVVPGEQGGTVLLVGDPTDAAVQALIRCDPGGFAERELAERRAVGLPPAVKAAQLVGDPDAVTAFLDNDPFEGVEVLGPTVIGEEPTLSARALLRSPLEQGRAFVRGLKAAAAIRSARKEGGRLSIHVDPMNLE
ncbi:MAG: primosomal protein N' [Propionibacteriaceae bacterium]|nr:primosomal protein N' [Propionibacteriaceae bacterium]